MLNMHLNVIPLRGWESWDNSYIKSYQAFFEGCSRGEGRGGALTPQRFWPVLCVDRAGSGFKKYSQEKSHSAGRRKVGLENTEILKTKEIMDGAPL